jgi:hypothetical protein
MSKSNDFVSNSARYPNGHQRNATTGPRVTAIASKTEASRRSFLTTGAAVGAGLLLDQTAGAMFLTLLIFWSHPPGSNRRPADYEVPGLAACD